MNIKVEQLAKKPFEVKGSVKNLKKTYQFQKDMAEMKGLTEDKQGVEVFDAMTNMLDELIEYIDNMLHLTDKQHEAIEDMEQEEVINIAQYVAMRLMGMSEAEIEKALSDDSEEGLEATQKAE